VADRAPSDGWLEIQRHGLPPPSCSRLSLPALRGRFPSVISGWNRARINTHRPPGSIPSALISTAGTNYRADGGPHLPSCRPLLALR